MLYEIKNGGTVPGHERWLCNANALRWAYGQEAFQTGRAALCFIHGLKPVANGGGGYDAKTDGDNALDIIKAIFKEPLKPTATTTGSESLDDITPMFFTLVRLSETDIFNDASITDPHCKSEDVRNALDALALALATSELLVTESIAFVKSVRKGALSDFCTYVKKRPQNRS